MLEPINITCRLYRRCWRHLIFRPASAHQAIRAMVAIRTRSRASDIERSRKAWGEWEASRHCFLVPRSFPSPLAMGREVLRPEHRGARVQIFGVGNTDQRETA